MQHFKGDETELKIYEAFKVLFDNIDLAKDELFENAYSPVPLGSAIWDTNASPLVYAIKREIFESAFEEIFEAFVTVGTGEAYLTVFRKIFGDSVEITFTVPDDGELQIGIVAESVELYDLITRYVEDEAYLFDEIIDEEGDNIALQIAKGFESQAEVEQMLFEMVPAGVYTTITLTIDP